jgi:lipopolysaccharide export system protein LptA
VREILRVIRSGSLATAIVAGLTGSAALAQANKGVPNAVQGFSTNRDQPVQIEAGSLEVRDKSGVATFSGNVKVVQGDTTMRSKSLVVFYQEQGAPGGVKTTTPGPGGQQQISRLEAKGGVIVTQKEQTATGDMGLFDLKANTVTLIGNVVVSQGQNVLKGERLVVDLTSGVSRVESKNPGERVKMLVQPGSQTPGGGTTPTGPRLGPRPFSSN